MKKLMKVVIITIALLVVAGFFTSGTELAVGYEYTGFDNLHYEKSPDIHEELSNLTVKQMKLKYVQKEGLEEIESIENAMMYSSVLTPLANEPEENKETIQRYFDYYPKIWLKVRTVGDQCQYVSDDHDNNCGLTLMKAEIISGCYTKSDNGELPQTFKEKTKDGLYLAQTFYMQDEENGKKVLYALNGSKQQPLIKEHTYLVCIKYLVGVNSDEQKDLPVFLFSENWFWDMQASSDEKLIEQYKNAGLYGSYDELQKYAGFANEQYESVLNRGRENTSENTWMIPMLICVGIFACLAVGAVILTVKKRKKKSANAPDKPDDHNPGAPAALTE